MYWFHRPPYLRYALAIGICTAALWAEFRPHNTVEHPFASQSIPAGSQLEHDLFTMRDVPAGLMRPVDVAGRAQHDIEEGEPLTAGLIESDVVPVPSDWWTLAIALGQDVIPGDHVRLVLRIEPETIIVDGIVIRAGTSGQDDFGFEQQTAVVAVPPDAASSVAIAVTDHRLTALVGVP